MNQVIPLKLAGLATAVIIMMMALELAASPARAEAPGKTGLAETLYCEKRKLGYWFYCHKEELPENSETKPDQQKPQPSAAERLQKVTDQLRELKAKAILEPTRENVIRYIRFQREQLDRASLFSDVWQRAIWQQPDLDYTLKRPVSTLAKRRWQDDRSARREALMANLGQRYGLFYFFAQSCGACEIMSSIVTSISKRWRLTIRAISTDGGPSRHFPDYTVENGHRARMGLKPKITPALVLWDSAKNRAIPIGYGIISTDELQERIYLLTSKEAGHDY